MSDLDRIKQAMTDGEHTDGDLEWCVDEIERLTADLAIWEGTAGQLDKKLQRLTAEKLRVQQHCQSVIDDCCKAELEVDRLQESRERVMRIVTDYKHAQQIIVEQDAKIERLQARVEVLEGGRSNWYCEICGCSDCLRAEAATEQEE